MPEKGTRLLLQPGDEAISRTNQHDPLCILCYVGYWPICIISPAQAACVGPYSFDCACR